MTAPTPQRVVAEAAEAVACTIATLHTIGYMVEGQLRYAWLNVADALLGELRTAISTDEANRLVVEQAAFVKEWIQAQADPSALGKEVQAYLNDMRQTR